MSYTVKKEKNTAVFTLTIPKEAVAKAMDQAAIEMSKSAEIKGFRPGKAPVETVRKQLGEMKLLDIASEELIRNEFVAAMLAEDLETVGQPHFHAHKLAPGNDLIIEAEVILSPKLTKFASLKGIKIKKGVVKATKEQIERAHKDLALMQTKEVRAAKGEALVLGDKAVINLTMKQGGVVLEGGEGRSHGVYTNEGHYITGMVDAILGMKEDEKRSFTLPFPKDHYQKHLAGKDVDFDVELTEIFHLEAPAIDDAFAQTVGLKSAKELEAKIVENIEQENKLEVAKSEEKQLFDALISKSTFDEIPDVLINAEIRKMIQELSASLEERGLDLDTYLKQIGKTSNDLKLDFTASALDRIKAALILKHVIETESIKASEKEIDAQVDEIAEHYKGQKEIQDRIYSPEYRDFVEQQLKHKKALEWLKAQIG
jgi:trigger factor